MRVTLGVSRVAWDRGCDVTWCGVECVRCGVWGSCSYRQAASCSCRVSCANWRHISAKEVAVPHVSLINQMSLDIFTRVVFASGYSCLCVNVCVCGCLGTHKHSVHAHPKTQQTYVIPPHLQTRHKHIYFLSYWICVHHSDNSCQLPQGVFLDTIEDGETHWVEFYHNDELFERKGTLGEWDSPHYEAHTYYLQQHWKVNWRKCLHSNSLLGYFMQVSWFHHPQQEWSALSGKYTQMKLMPCTIAQMDSSTLKTTTK